MHSSNLKWYIVILFLVLILGFLIFLSLNANSLKRSVSTGPSSQNAMVVDFSLFDSVNASMNGKITEVENGKIFFENQKGAKGESLISEGISISDMNTNDLPSPDIKKIQLNKPVGIYFNIKDGKYYAISITYPQP